MFLLGSLCQPSIVPFGFVEAFEPARHSERLQRAADIASDSLANASAELTPTPFEEVIFACNPLPLGPVGEVTPDICILPPVPSSSAE